MEKHNELLSFKQKILIMKKLVSLLLFASGIFISEAFAQTQLRNFDDLVHALNTGKTVRAVIHYGDCMLIDDNEIQESAPDAVGGMDFDVYEYIARQSVRNEKAFVVSSAAKLIQNPKGEGFVYNYGKIRADEDGKVKITVNYVNPTDYSVLMDENFFTEINDGNNKGAAYFYIKSCE
jgi:hypothetical protein